MFMEEKNFKPEIDNFFSKHIPKLEEGDFLARIFAQHCDLYDAYTTKGEKKLLHFSGRLKNVAHSHLMKPYVGDWVISRGENRINIIKSILPRKSIVKRISQKYDEQVLAVNCSIVLIVNSADKKFSISRLKKYVALAEKNSLPYEIILTKKDLCKDFENLLKEVEENFKRKVFFINSLNPHEVESLKPILKKGETSLLIGPSGSGKSTIVNALYGRDIMKTSAVREKDFKGRHTTTVRRIIALPWGHCITDIPGIKLIEEELPISMSEFRIIEEKALECRFSNCKHYSEPDCAVKRAVESGEISQDIYDKWLKTKFREKPEGSLS